MHRLVLPAVAIIALVGASASRAADEADAPWRDQDTPPAAAHVTAHQLYLTVKNNQIRGTETWTVQVRDTG
ncbi:MAG: hypothetical protein AB8H79_25005, partial [Myxococcota bacterium]